MKNLLRKLRISLILLALAPAFTLVNAQTPPPAFNFTIANDVQVSDRVLEFDLFLVSMNPAVTFELGGIQAGILVNPAIYNSGTITVSILAGSSQLNIAQAPSNVVWAQDQNTIKLTAKAPPGAGNGTIISTTAPGMKVCRLQITNTVPFGQSTADLSFNFTTIPYPTKVAAYIAGINTLLTCDASNCFSNAANAALNGNAVTPVITGNSTACEGSTGNVYSTQAGMTNYVWTVSAGGSVAAGGTSTDNTVTVKWNTPGNQSVSVNFTSSGITPANPTLFPVTVNPLPAQPGNFTASSASVCQGASGVAYTIPDDPLVTYSWNYSGNGATITGTGNSVTVAFSASATSGSLSVTATNSCGTSIARNISITVGATAPASVSIAASPAGAICAGSSVTFTATPTNDGAPTYQWYKGASAITGVTGPTFTSTTLTNGDIITVRMTSSLACVTGSPATSNPITAVVNSTAPASVSIAASPAGAICAGSSVTFTATPANGGAPTYQWYKGASVITGETGPTFTSTTIANGDIITVRMTSSLACATGSPATSNAITAVVNSTAPASVSIAASPAGAICAGSSVTFTATPANGGAPTYQWYKGASAITGETGPTFTSTTLANGDIITVRMASSLACATGSPATSNAITAVVNSTAPASVTIAASPAGAICAGSSVTFSATPANGGAPTYQWYKGASAITGETGPTFTSTTLANGDIITVRMTSSLPCATGSPATSNPITAVVNSTAPASVTIAASPAGAICAGSSVTFTATPANGGAPTYQWYKGASAITGETGPTYTSTTLANGDIIIVRMTSSLACATGSPATSNPITAVVNSTAPASVSIAASPAGAICAGSSVTFTATPANGGAPTYQWYKGASAITGETGPTFTSTTLSNGDIITVRMTSSLACATGSPATSNPITAVVNSTAPASVTIAASPAGAICAGSSVTFTATPANGGAPTYQWYKGASAITGETGPTFTSTTLANGDIITVRMTSSLACATGSPATSNAISAVINSTAPASVTIAASPAGAICAGSSVTFTATPANGGAPTYQWYKGASAITGETGPTFTTTTLANGDIITVRMASSLACATGSPATSNAITAVVNSTAPASVTIAASPAGAICAGSSVTFTATPTNGGIPVYQWLKSGVAIQGAINATYTSSTLANGDVISVRMTSSLTCATGSPSTSNAITAVVNPTAPASVSIAASPQGAICAGTSVTFTAVPANGGTPTYQWYNGATAITGATGPTYTSTSLANGNVITVRMTSSLPCATGSPATSNAITAVVNSTAPASVTIAASPSGEICSGTSVAFTAAPVNGGTPVYQWLKGGVPIQGATNATYTSATLVNGDVITVMMTSSLPCVTGSPATSDPITMTVNTCGGTLTLTTAVTDIHCSKPGTIDLTVKGGKAPYTYLWSNGATTEDLTKITAAGSYKVTVTDANGAKAETSAAVSPVTGPDAVILKPSYTNPVCGDFMTNVLSASPDGQGYVTYKWSVNGSGWYLNGPANRRDVRFVASTSAGTFTLKITDEFGCEDVTSYVMNGCSMENYCTYTENFYGKNKGKACDQNGNPVSPKQIMLKAFGSNTSLNFGALPGTTGPGFTLRIEEVNSDFIFNMLPGNGTPAALKGNATSDPASRTGWTNVPISTSRSNFGQIKNPLLAQTMTLFFNLSNDPSLGQLRIRGRYMCTAEAYDCGSVYAESSRGRFTEIPPDVLKYLNGNNTVADLYDLANLVLGGVQTTPSISPSDVNDAIDAINSGFDGCRILIGFYDQPVYYSQNTGLSADIRGDEGSISIDKGQTIDVHEASLRIYPNPFAKAVRFEIEMLSDSPVRLEIYSHSGALLKVIVDEKLNKGDVRSVEFDGTAYPQSAFIYRITTRGTLMNGTIMKAN